MLIKVSLPTQLTSSLLVILSYFLINKLLKPILPSPDSNHLLLHLWNAQMAEPA
jgi:hypothetical protein